MNQSFDPEIEAVKECLRAGYRYLFSQASRKGHWNEARSTALAAMCVAKRVDPDSSWVEAVRGWIRAQQLSDGTSAGSWGEEIWDSGMCVLALKECGTSSKDPVIENAISWIARLYSLNGRHNWHDEPWETSWAIMAILRAGRVPSGIDVAAAVKWLIGLQAADGQIVAPHYTAYLLLIELFSRKVLLDDSVRQRLSAAANTAAEYLLRLLESSPPERLWTGEAWSNGQIL